MSNMTQFICFVSGGCLKGNRWNCHLTGWFFSFSHCKTYRRQSHLQRVHILPYRPTVILIISHFHFASTLHSFWLIYLICAGKWNICLLRILVSSRIKWKEWMKIRILCHCESKFDFNNCSFASFSFSFPALLIAVTRPACFMIQMSL